jgi:hypothetical protein
MPVEVSFSLKDGESVQRFCPLWMHRAATCLVPAPKIITDELIYEIGRTEGLRVSAASSIAPLVAQDLDLPFVARKLDVQIVFEGTCARITTSYMLRQGLLPPMDF